MDTTNDYAMPMVFAAPQAMAPHHQHHLEIRKYISHPLPFIPAVHLLLDPFAPTPPSHACQDPVRSPLPAPASFRCRRKLSVLPRATEIQSCRRPAPSLLQAFSMTCEIHNVFPAPHGGEDEKSHHSTPRPFPLPRTKIPLHPRRQPAKICLNPTFCDSVPYPQGLQSTSSSQTMFQNAIRFDSLKHSNPTHSHSKSHANILS